MKIVIDIDEEDYERIQDIPEVFISLTSRTYSAVRNGTPLPSIEPERKTGKWIWDNRTGEYECSECGCNPIYERTTPDDNEIDKYRYCRWCGAPMGVQNGKNDI